MVDTVGCVASNRIYQGHVRGSECIVGREDPHWWLWLAHEQWHEDAGGLGPRVAEGAVRVLSPLSVHGSWGGTRAERVRLQDVSFRSDGFHSVCTPFDKYE